MNPYGLGALGFERLFFINSVSLIDIILFRLFMLDVCVLADYVFQVISPFHLGYQICGHSIVYSIALFLNILGLCINVSFVSDVGNFSLLFFFACVKT